MGGEEKGVVSKEILATSLSGNRFSNKNIQFKEIGFQKHFQFFSLIYLEVSIATYVYTIHSDIKYYFTLRNL